jgi:hypothetical protein
MVKKLFSLSLLIYSFAFVYGQTRPDALYLKLNKSIADTNRINILENLGQYYSELRDRSMEDIDSSIVNYSKALQLSQQLHYIDKEMKARSLLSEVYFLRRNVEDGSKQALYVIDYYRQRKDYKLQAVYTRKYAGSVPATTPVEITDNIRLFEETARLYNLIHDAKGQIEAARNIAYLNGQAGRTDLAEQQYLEVINRYRSIGYLKLASVYNSLATMNLIRGNYLKALDYQLKLNDNMEETGDSTYAYRYYRRLADNYFQLTMYADAIKWGVRSMQSARLHKDYVYLYSCLDLVMSVMLRQYKTSEALALVQQTINNVKPVSLDQKITAYSSLALCYANLRQIEKAEKNYLSADSVFNIKYDDKKFPRNKDNDLIFDHELDMAAFYFRYGKYDKAKFFVEKAAAVPRGTINASYIGVLHREQYKIDSATKNYQSALEHLVLYKKITDSIFNATKSKQLLNCT